MYETIDSNPAIAYSDITRILRKVGEYRGRLLANGRREVTLPLLEYDGSPEMRLRFPYLAGVRVQIAVPLEEDFWRRCVDLRWATPQGQEMLCLVSLAYIRSNLGRGEAGYLVCPQTGRLCRKLFTDGLSFRSRYAFNKIYYNSQRAGRAQRVALGMSKAERKADEAAQHNQTYKGKPTRWAVTAEREAEKAHRYKEAALSRLMGISGR